MSNPNPPQAVNLPSTAREPARTEASSQAAPAPRWFVILTIVALAAYAVFLSVNTTVVAGGADSSGYLNSARLLAAGQLQTELRIPAEFPPSTVSRRHFSPQGFNLFPDNPHLAPTYPTGLPLHLAAAGRVLGWQAGGFLVLMLAATGAVWLCYQTARELGIDHTLAAAAAVMLAAFPVFIFTSVQTLSDTLATTWTLAAMLCALRGQTSLRWAAGAGAAFSIAVLVRPTNIVIAPGLIVLLGFNLRRLLAFIIGGLPAVGWLAFYNHTLYGGALRTGYGHIHEAFALAHGKPTAIHFAKWLAIFLPAIALVLPLAALTRPDARGRKLGGLALIAAAVTGVYLFYDVSQDVWWCLRFILPAVAALILAAVLGVEAMARGWLGRWPRLFRAMFALLLAGWAVANSWQWTRSLHALYVPIYEQAYADAAELVRQTIPPNALVVCSVFSGTLYFYTELPTLVFDTISREDFVRYASLAREAGRPLYAVIFNIEEDDVIRGRCAGNWTRVDGVANIGLWRLENDGALK